MRATAARLVSHPWCSTLTRCSTTILFGPVTLSSSLRSCADSSPRSRPVLATSLLRRGRHLPRPSTGLALTRSNDPGLSSEACLRAVADAWSALRGYERTYRRRRDHPEPERASRSTYRSHTLQLLPGHFEFCQPGQDCWRQFAGFETTARPAVLEQQRQEEQGQVVAGQRAGQSGAGPQRHRGHPGQRPLRVRVSSIPIMLVGAACSGMSAAAFTRIRWTLHHAMPWSLRPRSPPVLRRDRGGDLHLQPGRDPGPGQQLRADLGERPPLAQHLRARVSTLADHAISGTSPCGGPPRGS